MADLVDVPPGIQQQGLARLSAAGTIHSEHVVTYSKSQDLGYEIDRKSVSLVQALGIREVTSQSGQTGIPLAGGVAKTA
jgi:hypothetical protein